MGNSKIVRRGLCCAALLAGVVPIAAYAATRTANFNVTATVGTGCGVSATDLNFGLYDPSAGTNKDASSTVTATCTLGLLYTLGLDAGSGSGATVAARLMSSGGSTLSYGLYTNAARSTVWGDGLLSSQLVLGTGIGGTQQLTVYGRIPASQFVADGLYTDTVTVTMTF